MDTKLHRKNARIIGVLFIIAAISAIVGLTLYNPILNAQSNLIEGVKHYNQIILGALFELILVSTAVGTGIAFFPYLKKENEAIALGYLCFRMLEVFFIMIGIVSILSLLSISQNYTAEQANFESYGIVADTLKSAHKWTFMLGPNFMLGINTFLYSYLLYRSKLIPRNLSILGIVSAKLVFIAALLEMFGIIHQVSTTGFLLAFPIFIYEMSLAIQLIFKGFNSEKLRILTKKSNSL